MGEGTAVAVEKNKENNLPLGRNMKNGYQRYPFLYILFCLHLLFLTFFLIHILVGQVD